MNRSSTCQVSIERIVLDLESEVMRGLGSIPNVGNIFHWIFLFSHSRPLIPILALLSTLFNYGKTRLVFPPVMGNDGFDTE